MKILIIEDEPSLRELMERYLVQERYVVETATTLSEAEEKIGVYDYDCILLDIMLPDGSGFAILEQLKEQGKEGNVIITSARDSVEDKVQGLELGADDYLAKPFHLSELNARIKSLMRRNQRGGEMTLEVGNIKIIPEKYSVFVAGAPLDLSRKEYDILHHFATRPGRLVEKTALAEAVWGDDIDQADNYDFIYAQVKNLRKKMKQAGADMEIRAVYGFGYKLTDCQSGD